MLPLWSPSPDEAADPAVRGAWETVAFRVALGVELVGHLEPIVDTDRYQTGFCVRSADLAALLTEAIVKENVGATPARAHPGEEQSETCDVVLPCRPGGTDKDVDHAVLAATKAAHLFFCAAPPGRKRR